MIGIYTYFNPINYGAVLQAYALEKAIETICPDEDVAIVDYCPEQVKKDYRLIKTSSLKGMCLSLFNLKDSIRRKKAFDGFIEHNMNVIPYTVGKQCKLLILGSDQIWNPNISRGFDPNFFGIIEGKYKCLASSYAASIGVSTIDKKDEALFKDYISNVGFLSVREQDAARLIYEITGRQDAVVDLDPTMLLDGETWRKISNFPRIEKPYVLVYSLSGYYETDLIAEKVAAYYNAETIEVSVKNAKPFDKKTHTIIKSANPAEFLGLIDNAEAVVTDSFHGTVFSLLFNKNIYTIPNKTKGARMIELLSSVDLSNRIITVPEQLDFSIINYDIVNKTINSKRTQSILHLKRAVSINN